MSHEDQEDSTAAQPPGKPMFLRAMEARAASRGQTLDDALAEQHAQAVQEPGAMTEDCLLPDEVEALLSSPHLAFHDGELQLRTSAPAAAQGPTGTITPFELAALAHARSCDFCKPLLRLARPRIEEKAVFLNQLRSFAEHRNVASVDAVNTGLKGWAALRASLPVALPILIGVYALSKSTLLARFPLAETFSASWPVVVIAGAAGGAAGWLWAGGARKAAVQAWGAGAAFGPNPAVLAMSVCATVSMLLLGGLSAYRTDRSVTNAQQLMVRSAIDSWAVLPGGSAPNQPNHDREACGPKASPTQAQVCQALEKFPVPGNVVAEIRPSAADVYWQIRGEKRRQLQLEQASIAVGSDGSKALELASGTLLQAVSADLTHYAVGEQVVAVKGNDALRVLKELVANDDASKYRLVRAKTAVEP